MNQNYVRVNQDHTQRYSLPFAAWELRLYLNTHPHDKKALSAFRQICASIPNGECNYACAVNNDNVNPGCDCNVKNDIHNHESDVWQWIQDPWPWDLEANMTGGCK